MYAIRSYYGEDTRCPSCAPLLVERSGFTIMRKVGLEEYHYKRYPHEFSGGQRQSYNFV